MSNAPTAPFKLSEPGQSLAPEASLSEYLRCYDFPQPSEVRYGYVRMPSPQAKDRVGLFGQAWVPLHAKGTVLLVHGFAEHAGNYAQLIRDFTDNQLAVAMLDLRGHGLSEGPRGHVATPTTYAEDVEAFINEVFPNLLPNRPLYVWGHSLGGLIGLQLLLRGKLPQKPAAATFTSPLLGFPELEGFQKVAASLAPILARLVPSLPVAHGISPTILSHDQAYLARRAQDPLIAKVATPKWVVSVSKTITEVQSAAEQFRDFAPMLMMLAGQEKVTNLNDARQFAFTALSGLRHKVVEFPGCFHELEKEDSIRARVVSESIAWFKSHQ
jgi:acylglycerol lipase